MAISFDARRFVPPLPFFSKLEDFRTIESSGEAKTVVRIFLIGPFEQITLRLLQPSTRESTTKTSSCLSSSKTPRSTRISSTGRRRRKMALYRLLGTGKMIPMR